MSKLSQKTKLSNPDKSDSQTEFTQFEVKFLETEILPTEFELLSKVKSVIDSLDLGIENKGFNSWSIEKLISAREKLSRYSEPLGEFITSHETKSDFSYIWRKGAYANEWLPLKSKFPKSTISDLESTLDSKYLAIQYYSMFQRRRADLLIRELEAVDRTIRSLDHRIRELERQFRLEHNSD